jgi:hypothetical protein
MKKNLKPEVPYPMPVYRTKKQILERILWLLEDDRKARIQKSNERRT